MKLAIKNLIAEEQKQPDIVILIQPALPYRGEGEVSKPRTAPRLGEVIPQKPIVNSHGISFPSWNKLDEGKNKRQNRHTQKDYFKSLGSEGKNKVKSSKHST